MFKRRFLPVFLLLITVFVGATAVAQAQGGYPGPLPMTPTPFEYPGWTDGPPPVEPPPVPQPRVPLPPRQQGLRIEYQRVDVTIDDQIATTHIEQRFVNDNDWLLEGNYFFPLPPETAVSQLTMWVNGQPIEAKILKKEEARQIYDTIVRQLRDPALLEYVGNDAIQANVFPIPPREARVIEIEYSQVLPAENGLIKYVYPQSVDLYTNAPLEEQRIRVDLSSNEAIRAIYSPTHAIDVFRDGEFQATVGHEAQNVLPKQDFELYYTISPEDIGLNLLSYREAGEDGFFMLLAAPQVEVDEVIAKDVILVLDSSGSMEGEKIRQAQDAAAYVIEHLNPEDRFNVVQFSTGVRSYAPQLQPAANAAEALSFIRRLEAVGGTNISTALLEAAAMADEQRPSTIIFLTDGLATEGITNSGLLLNTLQAEMPNNVRLFAFGVGNDVDPNLLDSLAQNHRGTTTYVRPREEIDEVVSSFYAKVSTPVLANISLDFDSVIVEQMYPQDLPDIFAGSQLVLVGRYRDGGPAKITLSGQVNGRSQSFVYADNTFRNVGGDDFIPRLWATRAIGNLLRDIRLHGEKAEWVQSVITLSTRYGIITPYTSYLIEEDDIFSQTRGDDTVSEAVVVEGEVVEFTRVVTEVVVEEAAAAADMVAEEAPLAAPMGTAVAAIPGLPNKNMPPQSEIRHVGDKSFVLRDGVWVDTLFNVDNHDVQEISFASEAYFDLLTAVPQLGQYLALGQEVLIVHEEQAYQTVPGDVSSEQSPVTLFSDNSDSNVEDDDPAVPRPNLCGALLALPIFFGFAGFVNWYGRYC